MTWFERLASTKETVLCSPFILEIIGFAKLLLDKYLHKQLFHYQKWLELFIETIQPSILGKILLKTTRLLNKIIIDYTNHQRHGKAKVVNVSANVKENNLMLALGGGSGINCYRKAGTAS